MDLRPSAASTLGIKHTMAILYLLAFIALLVGTAAISMALIKPVPVAWLYYHYFIRKPVVWAILGGSLLWVAWVTFTQGAFPVGALIPLGLMALSVVLAYRMHQETAFPAVDFPAMAHDPRRLPLTGDMQLAVIEYKGVTKAYPLDYVIHHHIVNDRFGDAVVALTYCAMCRSIIPFDVTDLGPLFVASFKNANMIVADRRTKTFFQQATFASIIGPLHPHTLRMIPFQILPWDDVKQLEPLPQVAHITARDLRAFQLPVPGVWKRIMGSEATPGLPAKERDRTYPARTRVIGVIDPSAQPQVAYLKRELLERGIVKNEALDVVFVARGDSVNAYKGSIGGQAIDLSTDQDGALRDTHSDTVWDVRGKYRSGPLRADLDPVAISDEYWFSWRAFHPASTTIQLA